VAGLQELREALERIRNVRVTVFGDFCLDAYWLLDDGEAEHSVETGHPVRRVRYQNYSLGGAANVAANLVDLGVQTVRAVGVVGGDVFGPMLIKLLEEKNVDTSGFETASHWQTTVYTKPYVGEVEQSRFDFGSFNVLRQEIEDKLIANLETAAAHSDAVILNQQSPQGISGHSMVARINAVIRAHPDVHFVVDARDLPNAYVSAVLKLNLREACHYMGIPFDGAISTERALDLTRQIHARTRRPAFITCGPDGIAFAAAEETGFVHAVEIKGPIDTVGAGDTVASVLASALGAGQSSRRAAEIANLAAAVTVRKLRTTGTATPQEILAAAGSKEYVCEPR
jgi:rfaE bifunctional protein kinase chain/domain